MRNAVTVIRGDNPIDLLVYRREKTEDRLNHLNYRQEGVGLTPSMLMACLTHITAIITVCLQSLERGSITTSESE